MSIKALFKAALVGVAVGVSIPLVAEYWPRGPEGDDFAGFAAAMLLPFPLGLVLGWAVKLPRWPFVGVLAPFIMLALALIEGQFGSWLPDQDPAHFLVLFAVVSYPLAVWLCSPGNQVARISTASAIVIACVLAPAVADTIRDSEKVRALEDSGIPLIAPVIPDYRLDRMDDLWLPDMVALTYYPTKQSSARPAIEVYLKPRNAATPEAACANPFPNWAGKAVLPCRQISPGVWMTRLENGYTPLYSHQGEVLVQVGSWGMSEAELLAVLPTFRSVTAAELATRG